MAHNFAYAFATSGGVGIVRNAAHTVARKARAIRRRQQHGHISQVVSLFRWG